MAAPWQKYANGLPAGAVPIGGVDPRLAPQTRQAQNEAAASQYAPTKAQADATAAQANAGVAGTVAQAQATKAVADAEAARIAADEKRREIAEQNTPEAKLAKIENIRSKGETALRAIDQVRRAVAKPGATGPVSQLAGYVAGTPAADKDAALGTLQAILGLDKLMELKAGSSTGASGLGQLSNKEMEVLRDQLGSLSGKQSPQQLLENLSAVETHFKRFLLSANGIDPDKYQKLGLDPFNKVDPDTARANAQQMIRHGAGAEKVGEYLHLQGLNYDPKVLESNIGNNAAQVLPSKDPVPLGFQKGAEHVGSRLLQGLEYLPNTILGTNIDIGDRWKQSMDQRFAGKEVNPTADMMGRIAASAVPSMLAGGPLAGGAVGNMLVSDNTDPMGLAQDAVVGGLTGKFGDMALRGISQAISPEVSAPVRNLNNLGVRMTPGTILGGNAQRAEALRTSLPFAGSKIQGGLNQSFDDVQHAMGDEILRPAGQVADRSIPPGGKFVADIQQKGSDLYSSALDGTSLQIDPRLGNKIVSSLGKKRLRPDVASQLTQDLQANFGGMFGRSGPVPITGPEWKSIDSELGALAESYRKGSAAEARAAPVIRDIRDNLYRGLVRQNPGSKAAEVRAADQVHQGVRILNNAASREGANNVPSPGQIMAAIKAEAPSGRTAFARGEAPLQGFASDVQNAMPGYANSRSAERLTAQVPVSKEGMMAHIQGAALAPLYSEPAQRIFQNFMMRDAYTAPRLGAALRDPRLAGGRGMFGAAVGSQVLGTDPVALQQIMDEDRRRRLGY